MLLASPDARGSEGRGFATAEGFQEATEIVAVLPTRSGGRGLVVTHSELMTEEQVSMVEDVRKRVVEMGDEAMARAAATDPMPHDFRAIGAGEFGDGTRFYLDLVVPS